MSFRRHHFILACLFLALPIVAAAHDDPEGLPHLRPLSPGVEEVVSIGIRQSSLFRALLLRINASDVVVYIRNDRRLRSGVNGQLTFVGASARLRYVLVWISPYGGPEKQAASLGHELMHVVEIADSPAIVDVRSLGAEYARRGSADRSSLSILYDTDAAVEAGQQIEREVFSGSDND